MSAQIAYFLIGLGILVVVSIILAKVVPKRKPGDPEDPFVVYAREQRRKREEQKRKREQQLEELRELKEELRKLREAREREG